MPNVSRIVKTILKGEFMGFDPGSTNLGSIRDVALSNPATNQVLGFDAALQKWKNLPLGENVFLALGADPTGAASSSNALDALLQSGRSQIIIPAGTYKLDRQPVAIPDNVVDINLIGDLIQYADVDVFSKAGTIATLEGITSANAGGLAAGDRTFTCVDSSKYSVGQVVNINCGDTLMSNGVSSGDKYGYIRTIVDVNTSTKVITIDSPLPRPMTVSVRVAGIDLAKSILIHGPGSVSYDSPATKFDGNHVSFYAVDTPRLHGITLKDGGTTAVGITHCLGGDIDCNIHDMLDTIDTGGSGDKHTGYGVTINGSTRNVRVAGRIGRCRHSSTTNAGGAPYYGESENCHFEQFAYSCTNKAVDFHRTGWGHTVELHVLGGRGGGLQIRCDNVTVIGGSIQDTIDTAILVQDCEVAPIIHNVTIQNSYGLANGSVNIKNDAIIYNLTLRNFQGIGVTVNSGAVLTMYNGQIDGGGDSGTTGVAFKGTGARLYNTRVINVGTTKTDTGSNNVLTQPA